MKVSGLSFFWNMRKNFKSNLVLILVLVLKSKAELSIVKRLYSL